ncbi:MAG TPA: DUF58 domain-containing protein [Gemmataceae bacterium]|jgi:uncharacterized protein (DUF58 family)|nr:DUF58 domain-containing protein [Gemmataceae bacterium]
MLPRDLVRQIRRLQIRSRRAVEDLLGGDYKSVFKGSGIAFEEVREYQPGDDIRTIDWNVTARMGHPFVKRFIEERELTVVLLVDASQSQLFSTREKQKRDVAAEIAALLAFCAISNNDKVGLIACSERVEKYVPPRKGTQHVLRLIRDILFFEPRYPGTCLRTGLDFVNKVLRRRAIVFLVSDFLDTGYEKALQRTGKRHDLIALALADPLEFSFPAVGLVELEDAETGRQVLIDSASTEFQAAFNQKSQTRLEALRHLTRSSRIDLIEVTTDGNHLDALARFFHLRERRPGHM